MYSEEIFQLACLESSETLQDCIENEYSKNMTMKLLNSPRIVRFYVVPTTHIHFKPLMLKFLQKKGSYTVIVRTGTRDVLKLQGIVLSNGSFFALHN